MGSLEPLLPVLPPKHQAIAQATCRRRWAIANEFYTNSPPKQPQRVDAAYTAVSVYLLL